MSEQNALPPDPMTQTKNRMAEMAGQTAKNMAERKMRETIKGYLPKMLWPLIPGERGSVEANMKGAASKWMWGVVTSVIISVVFFAVFAIAIIGFLAFTGVAVATSM